MSGLFEGLKENDLESLVVPLISVDQYESKLDDDSIVVGFFVRDREPAGDLNRFIQKGAVDLLDTDVSPAPNENGEYLVFVEMLRDREFPQRLLAMLDSLRGLTAIEDWSLDIYDVEENLPATLENLEKMVRLVSLEEGESDEDELVEFFQNSDLEGMVVEGRQIHLRGSQTSVELSLVDFGDFQSVKENNAVLAQGTRLDETAQRNVSLLQNLLGDTWIVEHLQDHVLLSNVLDENVALLRI
jgi:hypothetical protein